MFGPLFSGTADLYVFFYLRGLQLLAPGGMLVFISCNKWFRAAYGEKLRAQIAKTTTVQTILDFHDLPVFEAVAYPMIVIAAKRAPSSTHAAVFAEPTLHFPLASGEDADATPVRPEEFDVGEDRVACLTGAWNS